MKYLIITGIAVLSAIVCIYIHSKFATTDPQYLYATSLADQTVTAGTIPAAPYAVKFPDVILSSGITATSPSVFSLPAGATYVLKAMLNSTSNTVWYRWADVTTDVKVYIGVGGGMGNANLIGMAIAYITTTVPTSVSLYALLGAGVTIRGQTADIYGRGPWISIESLDRRSTPISAPAPETTLAPVIFKYNHLNITGGFVALYTACLTRICSAGLPSRFAERVHTFQQ